MKVNIAGSPVTLFGEAYKDDAGKPVEYRVLLENALLAVYQGEELTGEEKLRRWKLAQRIHDSDGLLPVDSKEVELLKTLAAKAYTTPLSAQVWLALEGELETKAPLKIAKE